MIRQNYILTFIGLLVFAAMTFNDTQFIFWDKEELIELKEVEREEEVKEGSESEKSDFKKFFSGGSNFIAPSSMGCCPVYWSEITLDKETLSSFSKGTKIPFFIMYCALRVHLG